ncbi:MAG: SsrA-binding protein SmpB [Rhodospirillales bacterium]|nr:SsrA-binding protein SmpB [Rhodospirillales bacterium]
MAKKNKPDSKFAAQNRKARHNYFIEDTVEAGIILTGTEVKSLRAGRANIIDAYAGDKDGELYLLNAHIDEFTEGNRYNHKPTRPRKLLVHRKERKKLFDYVGKKGYTLVPLDIHFNDRGYAKVTIGLGKGKLHHDKRATSKDRDWKRDQARLLRDRG